jgi:PAS domain-containing protein
MANEHHHEELIQGVAREQKLILDKSGQAIYIYLDDTHKICNKKFADLLGYKSVREWVANETPLDDVIEKDQPAVIDAYMRASEKLEANTLSVTMKNVKTGRRIKTNVLMAPIAYQGHGLVAFFIEKI